MTIKIVKGVLLILGIILLQTSLLNNAGFPLNLINITLVGGIFIGSIKSFRTASIFIFLIGPFLDFLSPLFFPALTICYLFTLWVASKMFLRFFTNRSFYSMVILTSVSIIVFNLFYNVILFFDLFIKMQTFYPHLLFSTQNIYWIFFQIIVNGILSAILFGVFYFLSNKFQIALIKTK